MTAPLEIRGTALIAVLVCSLGFAVCDDFIPRVKTVDVGGGKDGGFVDGFEDPEVIEGTTGRWTETSGEVRFRHVGPFPATVRLRLAGSQGGETQEVAFLVNHVEIAHASVNSSFEKIDLPVRQGTYAADLSVAIKPIPRMPESETHPGRVFVDS